jgi:hypothetical protein
VPVVLKSGSLNLLETSETVQACNGIALLLGKLYLVKVFPGQPAKDTCRVTGQNVSFGAACSAFAFGADYTIYIATCVLNRQSSRYCSQKKYIGCCAACIDVTNGSFRGLHVFKYLLASAQRHNPAPWNVHQHSCGHHKFRVNLNVCRTATTLPACRVASGLN